MVKKFKPFKVGDTVGHNKILKFLGARPSCGTSSKFWLIECRCGNVKEMNTRGINQKHACVLCGDSHPPHKRPKRYKKGTAERFVLNRYRQNAKSRGYSWELDDDRAVELMRQNCAYCGQEPQNIGKTTGRYKEDPKTWFIHNGLDRIDNYGDYTLDNVVPCCWNCNKAKSNMPLSEWIAWLDRVKANWHWEVEDAI